MGSFTKKAFMPTMRSLVESGLSCDEVKRLVKIPTMWAAKITGEEIDKRTVASSGKGLRG